MNTAVRRTLTLRDLIEVVSRYTRNDHETALWVDAILRSGLVRIVPVPQQRRLKTAHCFC